VREPDTQTQTQTVDGRPPSDDIAVRAVRDDVSDDDENENENETEPKPKTTRSPPRRSATRARSSAAAPVCPRGRSSGTSATFYARSLSTAMRTAMRLVATHGHPNRAPRPSAEPRR
jgi:hypothetical protein